MKHMIYCHCIVDFLQNLTLFFNSNTLDYTISSTRLILLTLGYTEPYSTSFHSQALNILSICQRSRISHFRKPNILRNPKSLA
ncbi:hypothetical protein AMTRI_Chr08g203180 [Amborella trichopoda]